MCDNSSMGWRSEYAMSYQQIVTDYIICAYVCTNAPDSQGKRLACFIS